MTWEVRQGDCREVMATLDAGSVDAIVTDPPYGLAFMGKAWDHGVPGVEFWAEALRVAKPGAHLVAFGGTRTYHRLTCAIEDAGWEIRDGLMWLYGSGFPKSLNVSKAVASQEASQEERRFCAWLREESGLTVEQVRVACGSDRFWECRIEVVNTAGSKERPRLARRALVPTDAAWAKLERQLSEAAPEWVRALVKAPPQPPIVHPGQWAGGRGVGTEGAGNCWEGWGTALKPAWEPIILARKPLSGTVAATVLQHGTGALNVDGCRIGAEARPHVVSDRRTGANGTYGDGLGGSKQVEPTSLGRWPTNVLLDEEAAAMLDEQSGERPGAVSNGSRGTKAATWAKAQEQTASRGDTGGASRFFYTAKSSSGERHYAGRNTHPTVKPVDLMRWLVRLVTRPGGLVLDPFTGSGSTGVAALAEGARFLGIELDHEHVTTARRRIAGPLFAGQP